MSFVKNDSLAVVKAIGETPDSLTEDQALMSGIISRDTIFIPVYQTIYNKDYLDTRDSRFPFNLREAINGTFLMKHLILNREISLKVKLSFKYLKYLQLLALFLTD